MVCGLADEVELAGGILGEPDLDDGGVLEPVGGTVPASVPGGLQRRVEASPDDVEVEGEAAGDDGTVGRRGDGGSGVGV